MFYEIVNPSDQAFFEAPNLMIAGLVTVILGGGQYSATSEDEDAADVPFFMFGGWDEWWAENGDGETSEMAGERHKPALVKALRSVCYGDLKERKLFDAALSAIDDPKKRETFIEEWNDTHRSSMNNIMGRAHKLADSLEEESQDAAE